MCLYRLASESLLIIPGNVRDFKDVQKNRATGRRNLDL